MKAVVRVLAISFAGATAAGFFAPYEWRWPAIGTVLFIGIFIAMRIGSVEIGRAVEKKFNGD